MEFTVGWRDEDGKKRLEGAEVIEAWTPYEARMKFVLPRIEGTRYEGYPVDFLTTLVWVKCAKDDRLATPVPKDFNRETFIDEVTKHRVPA